MLSVTEDVGQLDLTYISENVQQCSHFRKKIFFNFTTHVACDLAILLLSWKNEQRCSWADTLYMSVNNVLHSSSKARNSSNVHRLTHEKTRWVYAYTTQQLKEVTLKDARLNEGLWRQLPQQSLHSQQSLHKHKSLSLDSQHLCKFGHSSTCLSQPWGSEGKRISGASELANLPA